MSFTADVTGFKALAFNKYKVGKVIKASKVRHSWRFELEDAEHTIDLYVSRMSRKRKVIADGSITLEFKGKSMGASFPVKIGRHNLSIFQVSAGNFDLRYNNRSFQSLLLNTGRQSFAGGSKRDPFATGDPFEREEDRDCGRDPFSRGPGIRGSFSTQRVKNRGFSDSSSESEEEKQTPIKHPVQSNPRRVDLLSFEEDHRPMIKSSSGNQ